MNKMIDDLIGFIKLDGINYPFTYEDWILTIYFEDDFYYRKYAYIETSPGCFVLSAKPKILETLELNGIDSNNNRFVKFKLYDGKVNPTMKSPGPSSIQLVVEYLVFLNTNLKPADKTRISIFSKELENFLSLKPTYMTEIKNGKLEGEVFCRSDTLELESKGLYEDVVMAVKPTFLISNRVNEFDFEAGLSINIEKSLELDRIYRLCRSAIETLCFMLGRRNVFIEKVTFFNRTLTGEMLIRNYGEREKVEVKHPRDDLSINWRIIYPYFAKLFISIFNKELKIDHLPDERKLRYYVSDTSIAKDSAAFEAEFRFTYGTDDIPSSKKVKDIEKEVADELGPLVKKSTGKKKKIYKNILKHIHQCSLSNKIEFCLKEYETSLKSVLKKFAAKHSHLEIAETCSGIRNSVNHGTKRKVVPMREAEAFVVLRCLIYSMQLRRIGMKDDEIDKALCFLYKIY